MQVDKIISGSLEGHLDAVKLLEKNRECLKEISALFISSLRNNGKIIFMGNGGSAADAGHLAAELVGRFKKNRAALASMSLASNICIITAVGNDFGFGEVFSRQVEAIAGPQDVIVGISTSGESENVIQAIKKARELGLRTVGFLGKNGGSLKGLVDIPLIVPGNETPRIQEMHILAGHIICEIIEEEFKA
ncbi:MAG: SIS domain-containing protein [Candidatus Omnitrophota bacterium]